MNTDDMKPEEQNQTEGLKPLPGAQCSASERSADEWAAAARKAMNLAMDASEHGEAGTSEEHRKTAMLCFECERTLRQMPNAPDQRPGATKV